MALSILAFFALASTAAAVPLQGLVATSALPPDAPFSQPSSVYQAAIGCPNGFQNKDGGAVLLLHGTGSRGDESFANGPYVEYLPTKPPGFDVCWVNLPGRSTVDTQLSAEYVAYAVNYLSSNSPKTQGKISVITHSQGGVDIQWALTFWPSLRAKVSQIVALSSPYQGSAEGELLCTLTDLLTLGCPPAVYQQSSGSNFLKAENSNADTNSGAQALVATTSIYTNYDEIIQPEVGPTPSSFLKNATLYSIQDVCGADHIIDHFGMVVDPAPFGLAYDALKNGRPASLATFDKAYCSGFKDNVLLDFSNIPPFLHTLFTDWVSNVAADRVKQEPTLQPYVCERGYAAKCGPAGFPPLPNAKFSETFP